MLIFVCLFVCLLFVVVVVVVVGSWSCVVLLNFVLEKLWE